MYKILALYTLFIPHVYSSVIYTNSCVHTHSHTPYVYQCITVHTKTENTCRRYTVLYNFDFLHGKCQPAIVLSLFHVARSVRLSYSGETGPALVVFKTIFWNTIRLCLADLVVFVFTLLYKQTHLFLFYFVRELCIRRPSSEIDNAYCAKECAACLRNPDRELRRLQPFFNNGV